MSQSVLDLADVKSRMLVIRNQPVLLDRDVAELYGVETRVVNQAVKTPLSRFLRDNLSRIFTKPLKTLNEKYFLPVPKALWTFFWRHPNRPKTPFFPLFGRRRRSHATAPPRVPVRSRARSVPVVRLRTRAEPSACRRPSASSAVR